MAVGLLPPVVAELMMDIHEFSAGADKAEARMGALSDSGSAMFEKIGKATVLGIAGIGIASIKMASDFETQMTRLYTAAGAPKAAVQGAYGEVLKMGDAVGFSGTQMAEALYHPVSAGLDLKTSLEAVKYSAEEAQISGASLDDTTYSLSSVMKAFNQNASQAHDTMALLNAIVGQGDMRFQDFNVSVKNWAPTAAQMGISIQSMGAALAYLTDRGNSAEEAATRVTMGLTMMAYPSQKAATMLQGLGVDTSDVTAATQAFTSVMQKTHITQNQLAEDLQKPDGIYVALTHLKTALNAAGVSATEADSIMSHIFGGGRSDKAILSLMQNLDGLKTKFNDIGAASGQFDQAWADTQKTFGFKMKQLGADIENVGIAIGMKLIPAVEGVVGWFAKHKAAAEALAAAIGVVLTVSVLKFAQTITTSLLTSLGKAYTAITSLGTASEETAAKEGLAAESAVSWSKSLGSALPVIGLAVGGSISLAGYLNNVFDKTGDATAQMNKFNSELLSIAASGNAAGTQMAQLAEAATKNSGLRDAFKPIDDSLAQMVQSGNLQAAQKDIAAIDAQLKAAGMSTDAFHNALTKFSDAAGQYVNSQNASALSTAQAAAAAGANTDALGTETGALGSATDAANGTASALNAVDDAFSQLAGNISANDALATFQKDLLGVNDALSQNGKAFGDSTIDGIKNEDAFRHAAKAISDYRDAQVKNGIDTEAANKIAADQATQLIKVWEQLTGNKKAVDDYANQLGLIPKNLQTNITVKQSDLDSAIAKLNEINALRIQSGAPYVPVPGGGRAALATGGPVRGPGTSTSDSIPAQLSNGEYVINAAAAAAVGTPFLDALNAGSVPAAATPSSSGSSSNGFGNSSGGDTIVNVYLDGQKLSGGMRTEVLRYNQRNSSSGWSLAGTGFQ